MSTPQYPEQPTTPLPDLGQPSAQTQQTQQTPPPAPHASAPGPVQYAAQPPAGQQPPAGPPQPNAYAAQPYRQSAPASTATTLGQTNTYALLAIIFAFIAPVAAIVFGHMGLSQIKRTGDAGRGIGLTGLIIGYAYFVFLALFIVLYVGFIITIFASLGTAFSSFDRYNY